MLPDNSQNGQRLRISANRPATVQYRRFTSCELAAGSFTPSWLVEDVLAAGQPCVLGGAFKTLKTSLAVDLAVSLARGIPFLGTFDVPRAVRTGVMSAESGLGALQDVASRVARSKGCDLRDLGTNLIWTDSVPLLSEQRHLDAWSDFIEHDELEVIVCDPGYMMLGDAADSAGNVFVIGDHLRRAGDVCRKIGCTLIVLHHCKRNRQEGVPAELSDLAWSGWAEWAAQWLLLSRRQPYDPDSDGEHLLWLTIGGRAGHSGLYGLDVREGRRADPDGRRWNVDVRRAAEARADVANSKQAEQQRRKQAEREKQLDKLAKALNSYPGGATQNALRERCGWSGAKFTPLIHDLEERGIAERCKVRVQNRKTLRDGWRRVTGEDLPA